MKKSILEKAISKVNSEFKINFWNCWFWK